MSKPRAALYLRQSTYREESISLELQETACRTYAAQQGYEVVAVEQDPGISGRKWDNRPGVQKVMGLLEDKGADVIVLWKWSRLSRSRLHWAVAADKVETLGGRIESATEPVDVSTSTGRFTRGMLTEMAAFESERIGDSWKETQARRISMGKLFYRPGDFMALTRAAYCKALDKERLKRRQGERLGGEFDKCPSFNDLAIAPADRDKDGRFDTIDFVASPYVAGPYVEGEYDIPVAVTRRLIASLKPEYRASFKAQRQ